MANVPSGLAPTNLVTGQQVWRRNLPNTSPAWNNLDALLYLPPDFLMAPTKTYPLVISIHGRGGFTLNAAHTAPNSYVEGFIRQVPNTYDAVVIGPDMHPVNDRTDFFPDNPGQTFKADMVARLILDAIQHLRVDPKKVVVTGLSYGGAMTEEMMLIYQPMLAGVAVVAMAPPNRYNFTPANTCVFTSLPIQVAGNDGDGVLAASEWTGYPGYTGFLTVLSACPGYSASRFTTTFYPGSAHSGWDQYYATASTQLWLRSQSRP